MSTPSSIRRSIYRAIGVGIDKDSAIDQDKRHWRPSVRKALTSSEWPQNTVSSGQTGQSSAYRVSGLLTLPQELRDVITSYLLPVDITCLLQTCPKLRHEVEDSANVVRRLSPRQRHIMRQRLDRDSFEKICDLEQKCSKKCSIVACSFCLNVHEKRNFSQKELDKPPRQRVCANVARRFLVCGFYWAYPITLRRALEMTLSTGRDEFPIHHYVPQDQPIPGSTACSEVLSRNIEKASRMREQRSSFYVDDTGLVVRHHFHLQGHTSLLSFPWNYARAINTRSKSTLPVCPHLTIYSAGKLAGEWEDVPNEYTSCCQDPACHLRLGWFECLSDVGTTDLCLRVERRVGWLENVTDNSWLTI